MELTKEHFENHLATQLKSIRKDMVSKQYLDSQLKSIQEKMVSKEYFDEEFGKANNKFAKIDSDISAVNSRLDNMNDRMNDLVTTDDLNNSLSEQNSEIKMYTDQVAQSVLIGIDNSYIKLAARLKTVELVK